MPSSTGNYPDLFAERGHSNSAIQQKLNEAWQQLFYGDNNTQRVYYPVGTNMAYIEDIGDNDVRTEGMSYGMMIAVQMNKQDEFNRLWTWAMTYMYHPSGPFQGYFAWHNTTSGSIIDNNPATDGDQWFAMALFMASGRWGNGQGIYNYQASAQSILNNMLHHKTVNSVTAMFNTAQKQPVFVPYASAATFTDPSYQLPAFYELWARWSQQDNQFWADAATSSRQFLQSTVNPETGLAPDYANFDGSANTTGGHGNFSFDAWRVASNIAIDYTWFAADPWEQTQSDRIQTFFTAHKKGNQFLLTGSPLASDHSTGLVAMLATASLAATNNQKWNFVDNLWNAAIPSGQWRYYDGMLYMLGLLEVSGNYRIYAPATTSSVSGPSS